jgi:ankyrin repeat protein
LLDDRKDPDPDDGVFLSVRHGADLELKNKDGWTAFHIAARTGDHQLIAFLADISPAAWNTVSREQTNCFHICPFSKRSNGEFSTTFIYDLSLFNTW